jgi:hypothetical protein
VKSGSDATTASKARGQGNGGGGFHRYHSRMINEEGGTVVALTYDSIMNLSSLESPIRSRVCEAIVSGSSHAWSVVSAGG